jgi:hypothetical protein
VIFCKADDVLKIIESPSKYCLLVLGALTLALLLPANDTFAQEDAQDDAPVAAPAAAPAKTSGATANSDGKKGSKRTTINFEDQLIEGRTQKPELFVLLQNRMNNSRRLFKLRENFLPEMRKTAEDVGRAESNVRGSAEPAK